MKAAAPNSTLVHFGHQGRVVIVTGGAQGIGEACARRFAQEGARVVIADVADGIGRALATELGALYRHCDVGDKVDVDDLVAKVIATHGRSALRDRLLGSVADRLLETVGTDLLVVPPAL